MCKITLITLVSSYNNKISPNLETILTYVLLSILNI